LSALEFLLALGGKEAKHEVNRRTREGIEVPQLSAGGHMRRTLRWIGLGFLTLAAAGAEPSVSNARFMFPALVLLRESGGRTVALSHAGVVGGNVSRDTIAMLYNTISPTTLKSEEQLRGRPVIEVAEFFGPEWVWYASGDRKAPAFERANHFSRIYLPAKGEPVIWDNPVVAPGSVTTRFYELDTTGVDILARRGFKVR
jgi:hypothetical protein